MNPTHILIGLAAVFCCQACIYPFEADLEEYGTNALVVEGDILIGDQTEIAVSRVNTSRSTELGFSATVEGEDGTKVEASGISHCILDTKALNPNQRYRLRIHVETGEDLSSEWLEVTQPPIIDDFYKNISEDREELTFGVSFHSDGSSPYYNLAYQEEWEYNTLVNTNLRWEHGQVVDVGEGYPNVTCWNSTFSSVAHVVSTGKLVNNALVGYPLRTFDKGDRRISVRYHLHVRAQMISQTAYEYWENLEALSSQSGDLFAPIPSDVRGNVVNDRDPDAIVMGYISASQVAARDIWFDNTREAFYRTSATTSLLLESYIIRNPQMDGYALKYLGYVPFEAVWGGDKTEAIAYYNWIKAVCLDCRNEGGTTTPPENWMEHFR